MSCKPLLICSLLPVLCQQGYAACILAPSAANDNYVCDSGSATGLVDTLGNNALTLPAGGTGAITGSVTFGAGADRVEVTSGVISGAVNQGPGIDTFIMNGGSVASVAQGDGRDQFSMTGGTIVGAFEDGDVATFSGGRIGRVDMKLDNNVFVMTGGTILGNLVTGLGQDTITLSGGRIGGNISMSGGADVLTITGGEVAGQVLMSTGNDRFDWDGGGVIRGPVSLGDGNDSARLANLDEARIGSVPALLGNLGDDTLTFDHSILGSAARYLLWERVNLTNASTLDLAADTLTLGDAASLTGTLNIAAGSTLGATTGSIVAATAGQDVSVIDAGLLDLTRGGTTANNRLTIAGNYRGADGQLKVNSVLAGDDSPSDRLVVTQGSLAGSTTLLVSNVAGLGALTNANGIEVVQASQGATSIDSAFTLGSTLSAGAYQYYLFKGGVTAGSENSWFLRSSVVAPVIPVAAPPASAPPAPEPPASPSLPTAPATPATPAAPTTPPAAQAPVAAIGTPPLPAAPAGESIPLYRVEVPNYAASVPAAALLAQAALGSFHPRQGDQALLDPGSANAAGWARTFGMQLRQRWQGDVSPRLHGSVGGWQVGHDLFAHGSAESWKQHAGLFIGHARLSADVQGFALGFQGHDGGTLSLAGDSVGAYWTIVSPSLGYLDAVIMGTRFDGRSLSARGWNLDLHGHGSAASLEAGQPLRLSTHWSLEPQAQLTVQHIHLDSASDPVSRISFTADPWWRARLGARLAGSYQAFGVPLQPWLQADLWRSLAGQDSIRFDGGDRLTTEHRASTAQVGAGVSARLSAGVSVNVSLGYSRSLDRDEGQGLGGTVGVRVSW